MGNVIFGIKEEGIEYTKRPAAYCIIFNSLKNKVAIIQKKDGKCFLPGGGIDNNETHDECIKREALEEMGMEVEIVDFIGCACRYFYSANEHKYYLSEGHFYICKLGSQLSSPIEDDHSLIWMEPYKAMEELFHEHQSWAVKEGLMLKE